MRIIRRGTLPVAMVLSLVVEASAVTPIEVATEKSTEVIREYSVTRPKIVRDVNRLSKIPEVRVEIAGAGRSFELLLTPANVYTENATVSIYSEDGVREIRGMSLQHELYSGWFLACPDPTYGSAFRTVDSAA